MVSSGGWCRRNQVGRNRRKRKQRKKQEEKDKKKKQKKEKMVEIKKVAEEWEIWDKEKEAPRLEEKAKKRVPEKFHL